MHKMYNYNAEKAKRGMTPAFPELDGKFGDGNGGGDDMLERIKKLEEKVSTLVTDIAVIKSNYATGSDIASVKTEVANAKADLHSALRLQALTIIGSMIAIVGVASGIVIKFLHA
ncbi:uncharacterized protein (UPF0335 family) [Leclercia sp. 1548]|uniref:hemolysin XhlA n=1 Tax=Leclercia TaxID=83654 RepID=UPI003016FF78